MAAAIDFMLTIIVYMMLFFLVQTMILQTLNALSGLFLWIMVMATIPSSHSLVSVACSEHVLVCQPARPSIFPSPSPSNSNSKLKIKSPAMQYLDATTTTAVGDDAG